MSPKPFVKLYSIEELNIRRAAKERCERYKKRISELYAIVVDLNNELKLLNDVNELLLSENEMLKIKISNFEKYNKRY